MKILNLLFLITFLSVSCCFSQDSATTVFHIDKIPTEGILLDKGWKFQAGDNAEWAKPDFNDKSWQSINPTLDVHDSLPQIPKSGICWFRLHLFVDSSINQRLALIIYQSGASEIYLNGTLIYHIGVLSTDPRKIKAYDPWGKPVLFPASKTGQQILAARYALQPGIFYTTMFNRQNPALQMRVNNMETSIEQYYLRISSSSSDSDTFRMGVFFILVILHLAFYLFYPSQKANLYFCLYAVFSLAGWIIGAPVHEVEHKFYYYNLALDFEVFSYLFMVTALYFLLEQKKGWLYWALMGFIFICIPLNVWPYTWGWAISLVVMPNLISLEITRVAFISIKVKKRGAWIIAGGAISYLVFSVALLLSGIFGIGEKNLFNLPFTIFDITFNLANFSIPVAASIYLGLDFAFTNRSLKQKLVEVEGLSQKTIAQEQEKQQILASQYETLEQQVTERTYELKKSLEDLKATQAQLIQSEKMASLGELTAGIAHEIQNPLNFVNNFSEVNKELIEELKTEASAGNNSEVIAIANDISANEEKINHHGKRADAIVKGMLQHSRKSSGQKESTDINALCDEYLRLSYHGMRAKDKFFNATIETDFDNSIEKINIIPQDIGRVLLNLYNNAFYAVSEKKKQAGENLPAGQAGYEPTVSISTKRISSPTTGGAGGVIISVRDNGNGIPQNIVDKIFQPFFTTKPTGEGTGLGLSLSYDIIKAHGGEIKVETKVDEGNPDNFGKGKETEFKIQLPNN